MLQKKITARDAGQRFDKYLHKLLPEAGNGFLYKMLRKKNITLNGQKADGSEKVSEGDSVEIFFSDETLEKFMGKNRLTQIINGTSSSEMRQNPSHNEYSEAYRTFSDIGIIYENDHILLADKPAGVLSQKAGAKDLSLNEWLVGYQLSAGKITPEELDVFKPSVCNRLDRNTSGIVMCSKSIQGAQLLGNLLKSRDLHKYYQLYVKGSLKEEGLIEGYLVKDGKRNKVCVVPAGGMRPAAGCAYIRTAYRPLRIERDKTLLEAELITGKSHQIRAHMASIGHPILGDEKYGDREWNALYREKYHIGSQLLHACKVVFPPLEAPFEDISGRTFTAKLPPVFTQLMED